MPVGSNTSFPAQSLDDSSLMNNKHIAESIENAIGDINEIMRSKVASINGNCIQGYKIEIIKLKEERDNFNIYNQSIFLVLSAIGDALEVSLESDEHQHSQVKGLLGTGGVDDAVELRQNNKNRLPPISPKPLDK